MPFQIHPPTSSSSPRPPSSLSPPPSPPPSPAPSASASPEAGGAGGTSPSAARSAPDSSPGTNVSSWASRHSVSTNASQNLPPNAFSPCSSSPSPPPSASSASEPAAASSAACRSASCSCRATAMRARETGRGHEARTWSGSEQLKHVLWRVAARQRGRRASGPASKRDGTGLERGKGRRGDVPRKEQCPQSRALRRLAHRRRVRRRR